MSTIRKLSKELQEKAVKELNEDPKRVLDDIKYIKDWLDKQPHINARKDDQLILSFLRGCKFSLERTKEKLDMYYTVRTLLPEFFSNRDPMLPELQEILKLGFLLPLPKTEDPASPRIILMTGALNGGNLNLSNLIKVNIMIQDIMLLEDDNFIIAGEYAIQDMKEMTLAFCKMMSPALMKKSITCFEKAYPIRPKAMFIMNMPSFLEAIHNMMKMFLSEKNKSRMKVLGSNYDELYKTIPQYLLPKEYGGEAGDLEELTEYWKKKVESYRDWFLEDEKYKTNESKRPGKPKSSDELFGIEGSFRKLNVD